MTATEREWVVEYFRPLTKGWVLPFSMWEPYSRRDAMRQIKKLAERRQRRIRNTRTGETVDVRPAGRGEGE